MPLNTSVITDQVDKVHREISQKCVIVTIRGTLYNIDVLGGRSNQLLIDYGL